MSVIYLQSRGRPESQHSCDLRGTAADLKGLRPNPVAVHHRGDRPPVKVFRLTSPCSAAVSCFAPDTCPHLEW